MEKYLQIYFGTGDGAFGDTTSLLLQTRQILVVKYFNNKKYTKTCINYGLNLIKVNLGLYLYESFENKPTVTFGG